MNLSFRLSDDFVAGYANRPVPWGYADAAGNSLGEITFLRTYSRKKPCEHGNIGDECPCPKAKERWHEVCRRVIEGMFTLQKDHARTNRLPWSDVKAQRSAEDAFERLFTFKWTPPGRGLWMMGTPLVMEQRNSAALQNCAFVSTEDMTKTDPSGPFAFLMEASMLGIGVGFDTKGADKGFKVYAPKALPVADFQLDEAGRALPPSLVTDDGVFTPAELDPTHEVHVISDDREGWVASVVRLLDAYLKPGQTLPVWDYTQVRPAGEPIRTFGGTAAGPAPLRKLHEALRRVLDAKAGQTLTSTDILDIGNLIGVCVVSGNVRRSAELALGSIDDKDFLNAKNPEAFPERNSYDPEAPGWGWMSNNSVKVNLGDDLSGIVEGIKLNGEPGVVWMDVSRDYGRLIDPPNGKDHRAAGYNPCVTDDTWVMTTEGPRQVRDLIGKQFAALVDGKPFETLSRGFWLTGTDREVFDLTTEQGYTVRLTDNHQILTTGRGWVEAGQLMPGEKVILHNHTGASWDGRGTEADGYLLGHLWGDGTLVGNKAVLSVWGDNQAVREHVEGLASALPHRSDWKGFTQVPDRDEWCLNSTALAALASTYGMVRGSKKITDDIEEASSAFYTGFLRAALDTDGSVEGSLAKGVSIRLHQSDRDQLERVQRMLARLGVLSAIYSTRSERTEAMPNGRGGADNYTSKASWRLVIANQHAAEFMARIGFADPAKTAKWDAIDGQRPKARYTKPAVATFTELVPAGRANVYDVTVEDVHAFDANGLYVHNCAEQTLESYECCTLVETFLGRHDDLEDFKRTLKVAYLYAKTVTLIPTHWQRTNAIMQRNRRIGTSMSGVANFADNRGINVLRAWMDAGYETVTYYDRVYSEWLCVRESIKTTTVKPSGTVSILAGESPGVHWAPGGEFFERRIRFSSADPMVTLFRQAGYLVEPASESPDTTVVVAFPIHSAAKRSEKQVTLFEKAHLAATAQRHWSDNSVSVTLSFDTESEADHIGTILAMYEGSLKTVSFLPTGRHTFPQMPYTEIEPAVYEQGRMTLFPVDLSPIYDGLGVDAVGEAYCSTDACEVKTIANTAEAAEAEVPAGV